MSSEIKSLRCLDDNKQMVRSWYYQEGSEQLCKLVESLDNVSAADSTRIGVFLPNRRVSRTFLALFYNAIIKKGAEIRSLNKYERVEFMTPKGRAVNVEVFAFYALDTPNLPAYDFTIFDSEINADERLCNGPKRTICLRSTSFIWTPITKPQTVECC